jgi:phage terminase Nu1 subunit (DNA packaging protein)
VVLLLEITRGFGYMRSVDELLTTSQASKILGVTVKQVRNLINRGVLIAQSREGKTATSTFHVRLSDVLIAKGTRRRRAGRKLSGYDAALMAKQAFAEVRAMRSEFERLKFGMGLRIQGLDFSELGVQEVLAKIEHALTEIPRALTPFEVWQWARLFYSIGEEYFEIVEQHTGDKEPWKNFLALGQKLVKEAPRFYDKEIEMAYGFLALSRTIMRQAAFFYVRNKYGRRVSGKMFPETADEIVSPVILMAYNNFQP